MNRKIKGLAGKGEAREEITSDENPGAASQNTPAPVCTQAARRPRLHRQLRALLAKENASECLVITGNDDDVHYLVLEVRT